MKRTFLFLFDIILLLSLVALPAFAHPGRTDQYGGHMDHSTGEYHYHGAPDSSHSGGSSSGSSTNRDWGDSSSSSGSSSSSNGLDGDEIFDIILICAILGPFALFILWMLVISPIIDKINEFFHPLPKEPPTVEPPPQPREDSPVPSSAEQKQPTHAPPSRPKNQGSENVPSKTPVSPSPQTKARSAPPKTSPASTTYHRGSENAYTPAPPKKQPFISKPSGFPQNQSVTKKPNGSLQNQSIPQKTERFLKETPTQQPASKAQAATTAKVPPSQTQATMSLPAWLLDINSDYFTTAQREQFTSTLDISCAKRAITEQFPFQDLHVDESSTPRHATCSVISLNSPQKYKTTLTSCTCKDHQTRHRPCKHMIALAIMVNAITVDQEQIKDNRN